MRKPMNFRLFFQAMVLFTVLIAIVGICAGKSLAADVDNVNRIVNLILYKGESIYDPLAGHAKFITVNFAGNERIHYTVYVTNNTTWRFSIIEISETDTQLTNTFASDVSATGDLNGGIDAHGKQVFEKVKENGIDALTISTSPEWSPIEAQEFFDKQIKRFNDIVKFLPADKLEEMLKTQSRKEKLKS